MTEHQFLEVHPEDWQAGPYQLEELTLADLKMIYNALLFDTVTDGERTLGALDLIEKLRAAIDATGGPAHTLSG